jgi:hypothetical protein
MRGLSSGTLERIPGQPIVTAKEAATVAPVSRASRSVPHATSPASSGGGRCERPSAYDRGRRAWVGVEVGELLGQLRVAERLFTWGRAALRMQNSHIAWQQITRWHRRAVAFALVDKGLLCALVKSSLCSRFFARFVMPTRRPDLTTPPQTATRSYELANGVNRRQNPRQALLAAASRHRRDRIGRIFQCSYAKRRVTPPWRFR